MLHLIGIVIIVVGFCLKLNAIAVVIISGVVTGFISGMSLVEILAILGQAFVNARYMTLLLLTIGVIGILERNGLRERAALFISRIHAATPGKILSLYLVLRTIAAMLSLRLGGVVAFIRPIIYPMVKGTAEKTIEMNESIEDKLKAEAAATENYGNFFGQNVFVASSGVLLIVGTLSGLGITDIEAFSVAKASIPIAIIMLVIAVTKNLLLDRKLKRMEKGDKK